MQSFFSIFFDFFQIFFLKLINFQIHITRKLLIFYGQYITEICVEFKFIQLLKLQYDNILKFYSSSIHFFVTKNF